MSASFQLLVSVRSAAEAQHALAADIIDVKEPTRGPLGWADELTLASIAEVIPAKQQRSMACGELDSTTSEKLSWAIRYGYRYAKAGLSGWSTRPWQDHLNQLRDQAGSQCIVVPVLYADAARADAPDADAILRYLHATRPPLALVDTFLKDGLGLLHWGDATKWSDWITQVHAIGTRVALAGSLRVEDFPVIRAIGADVVAVRGAACGGNDREGTIDESQVLRLKGALSA